MQEVGENARVPAVVRRGFQVSLVTVADRDNGPNGAKVFGRSAPCRPPSGARVICVWLAVTHIRQASYLDLPLRYALTQVLPWAVDPGHAGARQAAGRDAVARV